MSSRLPPPRQSSADSAAAPGASAAKAARKAAAAQQKLEREQEEERKQALIHSLSEKLRRAEEKLRERSSREVSAATAVAPEKASRLSSGLKIMTKHSHLYYEGKHCAPFWL
jgi:hypothetical protein